MKNLYNYLTEKLKLSDIKITKNEWVDAERLSLDDIKEGYIIELKYGQLYVVIPLKLFIKLKDFKPNTAYDCVFVNIGYRGDTYLDYITFEYYQDTYPEVSSKIDDFIIKRVYIRNKHYTNADDAYKDVYDVCKDKKIK